VSALLRRIRAYAGDLGLLAVLTLVAALLIGGLPRLGNEYTDRGLQSDLGKLASSSRDLVYAATPAVVRRTDPSSGDDELRAMERRLPAPVPGFVENRWFEARVPLKGTEVSGPGQFGAFCRPSVTLSYQTGLTDAVRVVEGRAPASNGTTEAMVSATAARLVGLKVGTGITATQTSSGSPATIRVVGIYEPRDPAAPFWDQLPLDRVACADGTFTWNTVLLCDVPGVRLAGRATDKMEYRWRYRMAVQRMRAPDVDPMVTAVAVSRRTPPRDGLPLTTTLDRSLATFDAQLRGSAATVAVVEAGLIATVLGLIVLAALLMTARRHAEFVLLRARGAGSATVLRRTVAETVAVAVPAVAAGWLLALLLPGRAPGGELPLLALLLVVAAGVAPIAAARDRSGAVPRASDLRRLTAEGFVLLLAVAGVLLVRRRGLPEQTDPLLAAVPVLLGAAGALIVVRLLPWPLRQAVRLAGRGRGLVVFLGLARSGRGALLAAGPVAVLIVAVATGVFTAAVRTTIGDARDRATTQTVAADAVVTGFGFATGTGKRLTGVPGVDAAVPMLVGSGAEITATSGTHTQAQLVVVDGRAADDVLSRSGSATRMPAALASPTASGPVPAVVSPATAAQVGAGGTVSLQGRRYAFRVAAVTAGLPGLDGGARSFIALPWQALQVPDFQPLVPTRYLIAGDSFDPEAVRRAADDGQREYYLALLKRTVNAGATEVTDAELPRAATVTTWQQQRAALDDTGVNGLLSFMFTAGAAGAAALALLAVGLAVLAGAAGRGRALSRLRTMGLSGRQGRNLLLVELAPPLAVALLAGVAIGWLLPQLLGPVLGLDAFTAGMPARVAVDPWLPVQALVLLLAGLIIAVVVEMTAHRRMRLGESLRLGEEL
jgi:putative ABC transport system permease protein